MKILLFSPMQEDFRFEAGVSTPAGLPDYGLYLKLTPMGMGQPPLPPGLFHSQKNESFVGVVLRMPTLPNDLIFDRVACSNNRLFD